MVAIKHSTQPITVSYMITGDHRFLIMTNDVTIVDILKGLKVELRFENHSYHGLVDELPVHPMISFKQYRMKPISEAHRSELEVELQRLKDIEDAIDQMYKTHEAQTKLLEKMVRRRGLKLKPHLPQDSEMFSMRHKERVHFKVSLQQIIDQDVAEQMSAKFPQLKKCFRKKVSIIFDRQIFNKIQPTLPAEAIKKIVSYNEVNSLNFYSLEDAECPNCGGKYSKKDICKHCGLAKA